MDTVILQYWPVILPGIGITVWLARLEGRVGYNAKLIEASAKRVDAQENEIKHLSTITDDIREIKTNFQWLKDLLSDVQNQLKNLTNK